MAKLALALLLFFLFTQTASSYSKREINFILSGTVTDKNGEPVPGAYIKVNPGNIVTITNAEGSFHLSLPAQNYTLECRVIGMALYTQQVKLNQDVHLEISLAYSDINLEQVIIEAKPVLDVNAVTMGSSYLDVETLEKLPAFLGEVDVIRSITTLPGVVNAGDGSSGFYVRGGSADQNLILLDGAPVFNSAHLFGFFSVYNPDILKSYTLHRSGISAQYGGRISSILDVNLRNGHEDSLQFYAGISPVTAKIGVDGPIGSRTSFLLAGRAAYPGYVLSIFPSGDINQSNGYFYDFNAKLRHSIGDNNTVDFSSYYSNDGFKFPYDTTYQWSNLLGSLKWNHTFNNNLSSAITLAKSMYDNNVNGIAVGEEFNLNSSINFTQLKLDINYQGLSNQLMDAGAGIADYRIQPGNLSTYGTSSFNPVVLRQDHGIEYFAYMNDEIVLNEQWSVAAGLRYAYFVKKGPADLYIYEEGKPRSETSITDTLFYSTGDVVKAYHGLEPRASVKYSLTPTSAIKAGYSRTRQYIQIISNTATLTPVDVWRLSNPYIKPQIADQFSIGYFLLTHNNTYEFSWEVYYKKLMNQVDYKDGATILLNPTLEADLLFGRGTAYGSEWLIKKNVGKLNGWVSLTYARSFRTIAGSTEEETINNGIRYPSNYDKPLNLNIFTNYKINPRWTFSTNFNYSTGRPITASDSWFRYFNQIFSNYKGRNQQRMPDYHRLDLSLNYDAPPEKKIQTSWRFSVYNLYLWNNAYSTLFKHYYGSPVGAYKLSIIGIAVPSVSFNIKL